MNSFLYDFGLSELESFLTSIAICLLIAFIRKISLNNAFKNAYNISKFINDKF